MPDDGTGEGGGEGGRERRGLAWSWVAVTRPWLLHCRCCCLRTPKRGLGACSTDAFEGQKPEAGKEETVPEPRPQELASDPDVYEKLASSLAPSIWQLDDVKRGILCLLFGGVSKVGLSWGGSQGYTAGIREICNRWRQMGCMGRAVCWAGETHSCRFW